MSTCVRACVCVCQCMWGGTRVCLSVLQQVPRCTRPPTCTPPPAPTPTPTHPHTHTPTHPHTHTPTHPHTHLDDGLDGAVLLDEAQRAHGADAADVARVVAAAHDAEVDELVHAQSQLRQQRRQLKLVDLVVARRLRAGGARGGGGGGGGGNRGAGGRQPGAACRRESARQRCVCVCDATHALPVRQPLMDRGPPQPARNPRSPHPDTRARTHL
jgi:hypothetical protein